MIVTCSFTLVEKTLSRLRDAGQRRCECVMLWLGHRNGDDIDVVDAYQPEQVAREDMFQIPRASMNVLYAELRKRRLMVAAQVHSHPLEAFHSRADDRWAIIRHEGALSLVIPYFASETTPANFLSHTKIFQFSDEAKWTEVPREDVHSWLQLN
jgi:proteasome lid subunit RPN8/RPN11